VNVATTGQVLDKLNEVGTDVAVIKDRLPTIAQQLSDHERRLRSLEARTWYAFGGLALLAFGIPVVLKVMGW
jgi:quinol-cytochrome oxidoreductase complex cytochrome b subunit